MRSRNLALGVIALVGISWSAAQLVSSPGYRVKVTLASATNLVVGGTVKVNGFKAGKITNLTVQDGKAVLDLSLDHKFSPLHDGASAAVDWKALLGERVVNIQDGPSANAALPSGGMIAGVQAAPVELDQVLNALTPTTRTHLVGLVKSLDAAMSGQSNTQNLKASIQSAGPALQALGDVLRAMGTDGPAISNLVTRLNGMVGLLATRDADIRAMIDELTHLTTLTAAQRDNLNAALKVLPGTLRTATSVLGEVPGTVSKTNPLLKNLRESTSQLPTVAHNLRPVLTTLQPVAQRLNTTLASAAQLLQTTPGLLTAATNTLPGIQGTLNYLQPVLSFLRPYTPEAVGFLSTWASAFGNYDGNGHYARIFAQAGLATPLVNPGVVPPGVVRDPYPQPGALVNQPWTDAFGSAAK